MSSNRSSMSSMSMEPQIKNPKRMNHGSRSLEISNPMRRSFSGNPFAKPFGVAVPRGFNPVTPANSPSAYPRSSIDRSTKPIDQGFEEKENGMDQFSKQFRVESPGLTKSERHFMSPTISAVSKINASPGKKILAEKNELTRSSWGSLNICKKGDAARSEVEASEFHEQIVTNPSPSRSRNSSTKKVAFDSEVQVIPPTDPEILSTKEEAERSDCFDSHEVDAENKVEKSSHVKSPSSPLAPLDVDPLMMPYDPDTNYLSPRPQFLHYRPTPRTKRFLREETYGQYLNGSIDFVEGLSEAELTEETSSDDSSREPQNNVLVGVDNEPKGYAEVVFTTDDEKIDVEGSIVIEKEEANARDVVLDELSELTFVVSDDSDDLEVTTTDEVEATEEVPVVENGKENATKVMQAAKGLHFFTKFKFCALILAVLVAGMLTSGFHSPIASSGVGISMDRRLYKIVQEAEIGEYVKINVDVVYRNFGWLYDDSVDYIFGLIRKLRGESELCGMNYYNWSSMQEDSVFRKDIDSCLLLDDQNHERNVVESWLEQGTKTLSLEEEYKSGNEEDNDLHKDAGRETEERGVEADIGGKISSENSDSNKMLFWIEVAKQEESDLDTIEREYQEKFEVDMRSESIEELPSIQEHIEETAEMELGNEWTKDDKPAPAQSRLEYLQPAAEFQVESLAVEKDDLEPDYARDELSAFTAVGGISALVLTLVTYAGLMYFKPKKAAVVAPTSKDQQPWKLNKFDISPTSVANMEEYHSQLWQKKHASYSCPTVVDITGESCPSEMSSYQKNSFKSKGQEQAGGEVQNHDKRHNNIDRRESLASSLDFSTGSPSYGSFTTYEKIPLNGMERKRWLSPRYGARAGCRSKSHDMFVERTLILLKLMMWCLI